MIIHLLSGPTRSGKTTRLSAWAATEPGVAGLLMPTVPGVGRLFQDVRTGLRWPTAARPGNWQAQCVGPHRFSAAGFAWANETLLGAASHPATRWLLIDEIGPLELRGLGLAPALGRVLSKAAYQPENVVLVVRAALLDTIVQEFNLRRWPCQPFL
ncbi:hypothetical protein [Hymenobacter koreensis]|uniref:DUF2478 domain-containing protein n=1 Tax=Hymenobacter koreensis TaxID=1084523 RepID=A0ABP8IUG5_9BACT